MDWLIWIGAALSVLGIAGIGVSIAMVAHAKRTIADDTALRARIQSILPINLGALFLSVIGLMCVILGIAF
ncbi:hypothetical protein OG2516_02798 [Oceanicola granulosus HTCC2516]|uniref:Uncharacterized protein n=1 Tax=Oceanicola granulosus (strain ATCC BAA-861 / DSM 15982 / KCTC 12143 / HTCC2516) TaxID=314256 RepID=Q2CCK4_OCEGH|nr:hypothetical protein [Oceanicola granulosus]EAR50409.1 hypothetical protein OG2516_02798 [Oceanicola granulosus HTCC2516]